MRADLDRLVIAPGATVREAMSAIDAGTVAVALVVDDQGRLRGTVTDGDVRRALLGGADLDDRVDPFVSTQPVVVPEGSDRAAVLDLMRARRLSQIPEVDDDGRLRGLHVMHEVLGAEAKPNWAMVLAGGRGARLGEFTDATPKPMLPVAGRPILERLVLHLVGCGLQRIFLSVSYLAEHIEAHFGDGATFGCSIEYLREDPEEPLGTGGPLRLLREEVGEPADPLLVVNGDVLTQFSVAGVLGAHDDADAALTVALSEYTHQVPYGVARLRHDDPRLLAELVEKPRWCEPVNAGIYVVEPRLLSQVPPDRSYSMTELIAGCLDAGERVAAWHLAGEWHDVGRPDDLARARGEL